jgi:hypothetical protein
MAESVITLNNVFSTVAKYAGVSSTTTAYETDVYNTSPNQKVESLVKLGQLVDRKKRVFTEEIENTSFSFKCDKDFDPGVQDFIELMGLEISYDITRGVIKKFFGKKLRRLKLTLFQDREIESIYRLVVLSFIDSSLSTKKIAQLNLKTRSEMRRFLPGRDCKLIVTNYRYYEEPNGRWRIFGGR